MESIYRELDMKYGAPERQLPEKMKIRPLTVADADKVMDLEKLCFHADEQASLERVQYRLDVAGELCVGVFRCDYDWESGDGGDDSLGVAAPKSTTVKEQLVGIIIGTKTNAERVTLAAMEIPKKDANGQYIDDEKTGHSEKGRTIIWHSVAVDPEWRGHSIGYHMIKDYLQRVYALHTADGVAILSHKSLASFYEVHGFKEEGDSAVKFGPEPWVDMYLSFDMYEGKSE